MADNKKYYYLKIKDNFFDSDEMIILESMPDGYIYSNILLKLYLRSLKNNGKLMLNEKIPFNSTMLAQVTRHSVGDLEKAVKTFKELGIIDVMDNGAIYMSDIQTFIGSSSSEADRKREYRAKIDSDKMGAIKQKDKCPDKYPPERELEKEIKKEIKIKKKNTLAEDFYIEAKEKLNDLLPFSYFEDFYNYRKEIKKPLKTFRPLYSHNKTLLKLIELSYKMNQIDAFIDIMKSKEWQTLEVDYVHKPNKQNTYQDKNQGTKNAIKEAFKILEEQKDTVIDYE